MSHFLYKEYLSFYYIRMGYDKLISFLSKNLQNNCIEELFINDDTNGRIIANHIFFDINFIIYSCTSIIEDEVNEIIKLIFSLVYTDYNIIINKLETIINRPHWKNIKLNITTTLDGPCQENIVKKFINFLNLSDGISNINKLLYWKILFKLDTMINKIHVLDYIKSINIFFDGIPSYSKILEQRRRRIKNYIDSDKRKELFNKYFKNIKATTITEEEITFDYFSWLKFQFSFNKSMGPFSQSIIDLSKFIKVNLTLLYPNKKIYIDNSTNYGEADYKIFKYIKENDMDSEICIHSCDSDFIHLILIFQLLADLKSIDATYLFIRYYTKEEECYELLCANKINNLLLDKYRTVNNINTEINSNMLFDFLFIILMCGNDIIPISFEIGTELNLKLLFETHFELYRSSEFVVNINSNNVINFNNLKTWLVNIKARHTFTIVCLNRFYKLPYNFIIMCTDKLNYNINDIITKLIVPYLTYEGKELKNILDEDDIRLIYYKKMVKQETEDNINNPLDNLKIDNYNKNQLIEYMKTIFDYSNNNEYGLIRLDRSVFITDNAFQSLYNLVTVESGKDGCLNFEKQYNINFNHINNIDKEFDKIGHNINVSSYLKLLVNQGNILFNDFTLYTPYSTIYCSEKIAPSLSQIINFIELYDMTNLQQSWLKECYKSSKKYYFNSITHHLFITPYLIDSIYLKQINYLDNIDSILNVIGYLINGIWYKKNKEFKLRDIDPNNFIETCNNIIKFYESDLIKKLTTQYLIQIRNLLL